MPLQETNLERFKSVLEDQRESGIKSGDWEQLEVEEEAKAYCIHLNIPSLKVCFVFSARGQQRLIGAFNWKE